MLGPIKTRLDLAKVYEIDRAPAMAMAYGASWWKAQDTLDPDLTNPTLVHVLLDEARKEAI